MIKNIFLASCILLVTALAGCVSTPPSPPPDKVWIPGWKQTSPLNMQRAGSAVVVVDGVIYMIGGVDGHDFTNTVEYARIQKEGTLGAWQAGPPMIEARGFTEAVAHNGYIYIAGGGNGPYGHNLLRTVERAQILADGTLGPWQKQSDMQVPRRCSKILSTDKKIYSFGGFGGVMLDSVESAEFLPDGSLGAWVLEPESMTIPRYVNSVKRVNDVAYVIGGHEQTKGTGITAVEWSQYDKSGNLQKWQATTPMQFGRYGHSTVEQDGYIFAMGGLSGAEYLDNIERAKIGNHSGELGAWQSTTPLSQPLANFSVVHYHNQIYVIGGTNNKGYYTSVEYATLNDAGDIGFWGSAQEADAHRAQSEALKAKKTFLPNEGIVKEVIQTEGYTYLLALKDNGSTEWLAGPKLEISTNTRVSYSEGISMPNFYSRELKRNFPMVLFVGQVQIIQ